MIIQDLELIYGFFRPEEKQWVEEHLKYLTETERINYLNFIKVDFPKTKGLPDIKTLKNTLLKVTGKKAPVYYWKVCADCKTEYSFQLSLCPACYEKGMDCRMYEVKKSELRPPITVIRFNKTFFRLKGQLSCYDCISRKQSYCSHFGQTDWECREFRDCSCSKCCIEYKKWNEKNVKQYAQIKYGKPLDKGEEL